MKKINLSHWKSPFISCIDCINIYKILGIFILSFFLISKADIHAQPYSLGTAPTVDGATIITCSSSFYDSGGLGASYAANQNITVTFTSSTPGSQINFLFNSINIGNGDTLRIYNGTSTSSQLLYVFLPGTNLSNLNVNSYVFGSLTFVFKSNGSGQAAGWNADISCLSGCSNSFPMCQGSSINWMESGVGTGTGTLKICNLPQNTTNFPFDLVRDQNGVYTFYSGSWDPTIVNGTYTETNIPAGRNAYAVQVYDQVYNTICSDKFTIDFGCPSINIKNVKVSNCYLSGNVSKYTVCTEIEWTGARLGDSIIVNIGGILKTIKTDIFLSYLGPHDTENNGPPYTDALIQTHLVSSQEICIEVNANASGTISAAFAVAGLNDTDSYSTGVACPVITCSGTMLGGTVFEDYNADGVKQVGEYIGVPNITVYAFGADGTTYGPYITDGNGNYTASIPTSNYPIRVEFSNIPAEFGGGFSTLNGTDGRTTVQFIASPDCKVDLGVTSNSSYSQTSPYIIIPIYKNGDPLLNGTSKTSPALLAFPQTNTGDPGINTFAITADKVGSLWAQSYNRKTKKLFSAAFLRRHVGLGPGGYDAIYITNIANISSPSAPVYFNLSLKGINVGTIPSNSVRMLPANLDQPSMDTIGGVFKKVCYQGIGGMDISDDGNTLFVVNVLNNTLHKLDLSTFNTSNNLADITATGSYTIPSLGCVGGVQKSFACKYYKGKVYVGTICNGETTNKSNLRAAVYEFSPLISTFTEIMNFPLSYPKGPSTANVENTLMEYFTGWDIWHNDYNADDGFKEPVFLDIEFDIDGAMVLGFGDRKALQYGYNNLKPNGSGFGSVNSGGDILRAVKTISGSYMLENNAKVAGTIGYGTNNNQGPGLGEFYNDDTWTTGSIVHSETALGGLAIQPGSGQVISSHMDPITEPQTVAQWYFSGGVRWYNNQNGTYVKGYEAYISDSNSPPTNGTFSKAAGMGDVELTMDLPTYIEIGNYVWLDKDGDGIQDPTEKRIPNVNVALYKGNTLIATTVTNANGEYFFSTLYHHVGGTWLGTGADTAVLINTTYNIVFGTSGQYVGNTLTVPSSGKLYLTTQNTGEGTVPDQNDNDASKTTVAIGTYPVISVMTGAAQYVNHTLDAAFICEPIFVPVSVMNPTCSLATPNNNGTISISGTPINADKYRIRLGSNWTGAPDTSYTTASAITSPFPQIIQNNIPNTGATYIIRFYSGDLCYKDTIITVPVVSCTATCSLTGAGLSNVQCNSNGTPASTTDDYITFSLSPSGTLTGVSYTVTANNGGIVTPSSGTYGTITNFRLQNGSANGATVYTLTITDSSGAPCQITVNLGPVSPCSSCPNPNCGGVNVTRN